MTAAVTTATVLTSSAAGHHVPSTAATPTSAHRNVQLHDVAYVTTQTSAALAKASNYVLQTQTTAKNRIRFVTRTDGKTRRSRSDSSGPSGALYSIAVPGPADRPQTVLVLDHPHRAWWTYEAQPLPTPPVSRGATTLHASYDDPAQIADAIATGDLQLNGEDQVSGRRTLRLHVTDLPAGSPVSVDIWIDAETYLPSLATNVKSGITTTVDYAWLPRTEANIASLGLTPPARYTHHDKPITPNLTGQAHG